MHGNMDVYSENHVFYWLQIDHVNKVVHQNIFRGKYE
jgi:hypothetical protein